MIRSLKHFINSFEICLNSLKQPNRKFPREGLTWPKVIRFLSLPFCPVRLETLFAVRRFEEIPPARLLAEGIQGVLLDADGTLGPDQVRTFPESSVQHVLKLQQSGLRVGIFTNADESRFGQFEGVIAAKKVSAKPDVKGFFEAMKQTLELDNPSRVCMVGDNYVTDGGAVDAGMMFVYVKPIEGRESVVNRWLKKWGCFWAKIHGKIVWLESFP